MKAKLSIGTQYTSNGEWHARSPPCDIECTSHDHPRIAHGACSLLSCDKLADSTLYTEPMPMTHAKVNAKIQKALLLPEYLHPEVLH